MLWTIAAAGRLEPRGATAAEAPPGGHSEQHPAAAGAV